MTLALTRDELSAYLEDIFPQVRGEYVIESLTEDSLRMRQVIEDRHLRPGSTVSGPTIFALADVCVYAMVLGRIGRRALAVTTNCSLDFMRKPAAGLDLVGECRLLKLGRVLAVGDVLIRSEGMEKPVARATLTYSIPPSG